MISELRFVKSYNSLWRSLAPTMELFVRKANLQFYERDWPQLVSTSMPEYRALINQVAFEVLLQAETSVRSFGDRLSFVEDISNVLKAENNILGTRVLSDGNLDESSRLAKRMCFNLFQRPDGVRLSPVYKGCGIINSCSGDAITESGIVIELKDGDRPFRSYEFRQVSIYCALYLNETGKVPPKIEVINSRRGTSVAVTMDDLAREVAGQSGVDYLREIVRVISDQTISG